MSERTMDKLALIRPGPWTGRPSGNRAVHLIVCMLFVAGPDCLNAGERYQGVVAFGPEAMYFHQCSTGNVSWLHPDSREAPGWDRVDGQLREQPRCDMRNAPCEHQRAFVTVAGSIHREGAFGHLGQYDSEITITRVHKVTPYQEQCSL
jgi:hypothetical protein